MLTLTEPTHCLYEYNWKRISKGQGQRLVTKFGEFIN